MDSSVSPKDEIWFLRVCHHISNAVYLQLHSGLRLKLGHSRLHTHFSKPFIHLVTQDERQRPKTTNARLFNSLNPELNPICYLLALLGARRFLHVSRIRVKLLTLRLLMSYIYGAPILDVSKSHTTTQHSR